MTRPLIALLLVSTACKSAHSRPKALGSTPGDHLIVGSLTEEAVVDAIDPLWKKLQLCTDARGADVRIVVAGNGEIAKLELKAPAPPDTLTQQCIEEVTAEVRFDVPPENTDEAVVVLRIPGNPAER